MGIRRAEIGQSETHITARDMPRVAFVALAVDRNVDRIFRVRLHVARGNFHADSRLKRIDAVDSKPVTFDASDRLRRATITEFFRALGFDFLDDLS